MRIGMFSSRTGVSVRMLRYYEQAGLLKPRRAESGYRDYSTEDAQIVGAVVLLNRAGLPLAAIRGLLRCVGPEAAAAPICEALRAKVEEQVHRIGRRIETLEESRKLLFGLLRPFGADEGEAA